MTDPLAPLRALPRLESSDVRLSLQFAG